MIATVRCSLDTIQDEARQLVERGLLQPQQPIYNFCRYILVSQWLEVERELELNDFLLRDPIIDLLGKEEWKED